MAALQATLFTSQNFRSAQKIPSSKLVNIPSYKFQLASSSLTKKSAIKAQQEEASPQVYPPTIWGDKFRFFSSNQSEYDSYTKQIKVLKEEVKNKLMATTDGPIEKVNFIYLLSRLGLSYHFEDDIKKQLDENFSALMEQVSSVDCDLYSVALVFRVLRQNRYKISCDVLKKFKGSDGKFKQSLTKDVKGMLSLYEAGYMGGHGEDILDEAIAFTRPFLESYVEESSSSNAFEKQIINALKFPLHRSIPRLEARQYISLYEEEESRDEILLNFAKLDFNQVQKMHQQELISISKWVNDLDLVSKYPYARDRTVELYFWSMGVFYEPQYGRSREFITKILMLISVADDVFDVYGTLPELQCFTDAIERWNIDSLDRVPGYMKILYKAFLDLINELENEVEKEGRGQMVSYVKNEVINIIKAYMAEAQRFHNNHVPSLDEYMDSGYYTSCIPITIVGSYAGMEEVKGTKPFEWLLTIPKLMTAAATIIRLMDDVAVDKHEEDISSVECYVKQYGVSKEEATKELQRMIDMAWKDINEELMGLDSFPTSLLMPIVNTSRGVEVFCKYIDAYTNPEFLKDYVKSIFIQPITIHKQI